MIGQGNIGDVKCMHFGCAKRETDDAGKPIGDITISAEELQAIPLTDDQVTRYKRLKRKAAETKSTVYCPRPWCQEPASVSSAGLDPRIKAPRSTLAELAQCTACNFAFCSLCFKSWHGAFLTCKPRDAAKISAEEQATLDYMAAYSSFCPQCMTQVQKTNGCNHMECTMCHTHFCYLCSERLLPKNPYMHFNNRKSRCNNKLWDKEEGDGTDVVRRDPGAEYEVEAVPRNDGPQDGWMGPMGAAAIEDEDEEMMRIFGAMG